MNDATLMTRCDTRLRALTIRQQRALSFGAGVASILAMAPFDLWPVLWLTLPLLAALADAAASRATEPGRFAIWRAHAAGRAAEIGWWFGFGYHFTGLFWIGDAFLVEADVFAWLLPVAITLLPAGLALFTALATATTQIVDAHPLKKTAALAVGFGATEWLRGHILTGFPWNTLGYALTGSVTLVQSASLVGIYGLTVIAVLIFAAPVAVLRTDGTAAWRSALTVAVGPLAVMAAFGAWRLAAAPAVVMPPSGPTIRIVQPAIPQRERMQRDNIRRIFDRHLELSRTAPDGATDNARGISLIVWPEGAMPFLVASEPVALADIGDMLPAGTELLSGTLRADPLPGGKRAVFNSAMLLGAGPSAVPLATYDKVHLVPFGEYLPFQPFLEAIGLEQLTRVRGGFTAGRSAQPMMQIPGFGRVRPLICYEAIFPANSPVAEPDRPDLFLVVTNDSWFGDTTGPRQHFHETRVRAAELGVPFVRASANGISGLVDGYGRTGPLLGLDRVGTLDIRVPPRLAPTLYQRTGDLLFGVMLAALAIAARRKTRS